MKCLIICTSFARLSLMVLLMVRVTKPSMPRAMFGVLNTVLYFPSGAVYPRVDPFTYAVHAFKSLLLKNTGFEAIGIDILYLTAVSAVCMTAATLLFKRTP